MARVSIKLIGDKKVRERLKRYMGKVPIEVKQVIARKTLDMQRTAKQIITEKGLIDTGNMRNSVITKLTTDGFTGEVISEADYSEWVEFGTSRMQGRPFMKPAFEREKGDFDIRMRKAVRL